MKEKYRKNKITQITLLNYLDNITRYMFQNIDSLYIFIVSLYIFMYLHNSFK